MDLKGLYSDISDYLVYVETFAADFPPSANLCATRAFEKLFWYIGEI